MTDNRNPAKGEKNKRTEKETKPTLNLNAASFVPTFKKKEDNAPAKLEEAKSVVTSGTNEIAPVSESSSSSQIALNVNAPAFKPKKSGAPAATPSFSTEVRI